MRLYLPRAREIIIKNARQAKTPPVHINISFIGSPFAARPEWVIKTFSGVWILAGSKDRAYASSIPMHTYILITPGKIITKNIVANVQSDIKDLFMFLPVWR